VFKHNVAYEYIFLHEKHCRMVVHLRFWSCIAPQHYSPHSALSPPNTTILPFCRQLGSRWDAEVLGVSSEPQLFDAQTFYIYYFLRQWGAVKIEADRKLSSLLADWGLKDNIVIIIHVLGMQIQQCTSRLMYGYSQIRSCNVSEYKCATDHTNCTDSDQIFRRKSLIWTTTVC